MKKLIVIMVISMLSMASYSQNPTLVAHFPLNGNVSDTVGNCPNSILVSPNPQYINDGSHYGLHFDGSSEYIDVINTSILTEADDLFIISMWVKLDSDIAGLIALDNNAQNLITLGGYSIPNNHQSLTFGIKRSATSPANPRGDLSIRNVELSSSVIHTDMGLGSPIIPSQNQWIHVAIMHDTVYNTSCGMIPNTEYSGWSYEFFINGVSVQPPTTNSFTNPSNCYSTVSEYPNWPLLSRITIGRAGNDYFKGSMDDIRIYSIAGKDTSNYLLIDSLYSNSTFTAIQDIKPTIQLSVYPNPSNTGMFVLETDAFGNNVTYTIVDLSGKTISEGILNQPKTPIDLSKYSKGMYFVRIEDESKTSKTIKLIYQ